MSSSKGASHAGRKWASWQQACFLPLYFYTTRFFMLKMSRLLLLAAPIVAALCGAALGTLFDLLLTTAT